MSGTPFLAGNGLSPEQILLWLLFILCIAVLLTLQVWADTGGREVLDSEEHMVTILG